MIQPCILEHISGHHDGSDGNEGRAEPEGSRSANRWHQPKTDLCHKERGCLHVSPEDEEDSSTGLVGRPLV